MSARMEIVLKSKTPSPQSNIGARGNYKKRATTANVVCHMFVLSDGVIGIENEQLKGVQY